MYLHILFYIKQNSLEYPKFQLLVYYYENVLEEYSPVVSTFPRGPFILCGRLVEN